MVALSQFSKLLAHHKGTRSLTAICALCLAGALFASGQTFTSLLDFDGAKGADPFGMVQDRQGNLIGTTSAGGRGDCGGIFRLTPTGTLPVWLGFDCTQLARPAAGVTLGIDGSLYGTTNEGGQGNLGTVFRVNPKSGLTVLYRFDGTQGTSPAAALTLGADENFYGTTQTGGSHGTAFKITPLGALETLFDFDLASGQYPVVPLVQGSDLDFFGTTTVGGPNNGCGTIFRMTPTGTLSVLYTFVCNDGQRPQVSLAFGSDGNLYGTDPGGQGNVLGTIFRLSKSGQFTTLYTFDGGANGSYPVGTLVQGTDGNFYGVTGGGGASNDGTIFQMTPSGALTTLHSFSGADGVSPNAGLVQHTNGKFYGTTFNGGDLSICLHRGCGTVFSLDMGLGPFITFVLPFGRVGSGVQILGTGLTGATAITFNGVLASTFNVSSDTFMEAIVPPGATTGPVQLITPGGTLTSNVNFIVGP